MAKKIFTVKARPGAVTPELHEAHVGDEIECTIDRGKAVVVFEPDGSAPVLFVQGPGFDSKVPVLARTVTPGRHPFSVCYWYEYEGQKEHEALQMVLIIEP